MRALRTALAAAIAGCFLMGTAVAMPAANLSVPGNAQTTALVQKTAWVCGPYRCWWRPGPRYWGYGPRWGWYHRPYWRRRWW